jgi:hypothetical protein
VVDVQELTDKELTWEMRYSESSSQIQVFMYELGGALKVWAEFMVCGRDPYADCAQSSTHVTI